MPLVRAGEMNGNVDFRTFRALIPLKHDLDQVSLTSSHTSIHTSLSAYH